MRPKGKIDRTVVLGACAFGLVGLLVLGVGISLYFRSYRLVREGLGTTGELVDQITRRGKNGPYIDSQERQQDPQGAPYEARGGLIRFTDAGGKTVHIVNPYIRLTESDAAIKEKWYKVGDPVPLRYLPDNPKEAEMDDPFRLWTAPGLACLFGLMFLGAGFATYKIFGRAF